MMTTYFIRAHPLYYTRYLQYFGDVVVNTSDDDDDDDDDDDHDGFRRQVVGRGGG